MYLPSTWWRDPRRTKLKFTEGKLLRHLLISNHQVLSHEYVINSKENYLFQNKTECGGQTLRQPSWLLFSYSCRFTPLGPAPLMSGVMPATWFHRNRIWQRWHSVPSVTVLCYLRFHLTSRPAHRARGRGLPRRQLPADKGQEARSLCPITSRKWSLPTTTVSSGVGPSLSMSPNGSAAPQTPWLHPLRAWLTGSIS